MNAAVQERDVAVTNANDLFEALNQANADKTQQEGMSNIYREILRQRGGLLNNSEFGDKTVTGKCL